ncbi:hypothetical protein [Rubrivirga sp.]|uniref:hypothetical protein n=1 Tax=Rubrivirga sp. TaxID=1885344 RepID=UPI003B51D937
MRSRVSLIALALLVCAPPLSAQALRADGPAVRLFSDDAPAARPAWSPDGAWIAFTRDQLAGLWVVRPDGSGARPLADAPAAGFGFAWSPDGTAIAARTARYDGPIRRSTVSIFGLDGTATALTDERTSAVGLPRWAGPGHVAVVTGGALDVLAVDANARAVPAGTVPAAGLDGGLSVAEVGSGVVREVGAFEGERLLNVTPSPDGTRIAFEVVGGHLFVSGLDGSGRVDLGPGGRPSWSPDGRWVVFQTTEDDGHQFTASDLVAARADGSARVALTQTADRFEMNPSWSPDGRAIAFDADGALFLLPVSE